MALTRAILIAAVLAFLLGIATAAKADWSIASHFGPSLPHGPAAHVGRLYYHPGQHGGSGGGTDTGELGQFLRAERRAKAQRCKVLHAEYFARHGVTTPGPLKGKAGCDKWARDAAYWRARRNEVHPHTDTLPQFTAGLLRNFFGF